jgi:PilZ domain-containing protein
MTESVISGWATVERRRARRFTVNWEVVIKGKDALGYKLREIGSLKNLSSRGALLSIPRQLRVGMRLELWIQVPSGPDRWIAYSAEVVRIHHSRSEFGTATKFLSVRPRLHSKPPEASDEELEIWHIH